MATISRIKRKNIAVAMRLFRSFMALIGALVLILFFLALIQGDR